MRSRRRASVPREPAQLGEQGWLAAHFDLARLGVGRGREQHAGVYRYVGVVAGHYAFAPATADPVLYLQANELVSFRPTGGAE